MAGEDAAPRAAPPATRQRTAIGLTGEPTAPRKGSGGAEKRKSQAPRARQERAQLVELEDLADEQPHVHDPDRVERERQVVAAGNDLEGPVVGCDRRHVAVAEPGQGVPPEARLVALDEAIPRVLAADPSEVAGAHEQRVAASHLDALRRERRLELGDRDVVVGRERLDAELGRPRRRGRLG